MAKKRNRNKKRTARGISIPYPGPLLSILIATAVVSLVYLWICGRCESLGREIGELESVRTELSQQLNLEKSRWARHESMEGIIRGLARWDIRMSLPEAARVVVVRRRSLLEEGEVAAGVESLAMVSQEGYEQL